MSFCSIDSTILNVDASFLIYSKELADSHPFSVLVSVLHGRIASNVDNIIQF